MISFAGLSRVQACIIPINDASMIAKDTLAMLQD
jgi:hypothetical protein